METINWKAKLSLLKSINRYWLNKKNKLSFPKLALYNQNLKKTIQSP